MSRINASIPPREGASGGSWKKRILLAPLIAVAVLYLCAIAYLKLNERAIVFQPESYGGRSVVAPEADLRVEATRVKNGEGLELAAWAIPPRDTTDTAALWVLVCHGNAGNISLPLRQQWSRALLGEGVGIVSFDYRGYGASDDGVLDEEGLYRDAQAVYDWMTQVRGIPKQRIVIYGHSLGTGVATHLAARVEAAGLILEGAFTSVPDVGGAHYPWMPVKLLASQRFASVERMDSIAMPKLLMHATDDAVIPFEFGQRLFAAAPAPKEFVTLTGGHDRAFTADSAAYFGAIGKWLRTIGARDVESPPPERAP